MHQPNRISTLLKILPLLGAFTLGVSGPASADILCEENGKLAEVIMQARQDGVPRMAAMNFANKGDALSRPIAREMVRLAYAKPQMKTKAERRKQVRSFAAAIERDCARGLN